MRLALLLFTAVIAAPAGSWRAPAPRNVISRVDVSTGPGEIVVSIVGSAPPSFTTSTLAAPPRFVIDFVEASFADVPPELKVRDGVVAAVENTSFHGDVQMARVTIAFEQEPEPLQVEAAGATVRVRIPNPRPARRPALVAMAPLPAAPAIQPPRMGEDGARREADERPRVVAEESARRHPEARRADVEQEARAEGRSEPARRIREIGFRALPGAARVFIRVSGPPRFAVLERDEGVIVVELKNSFFGRTNDGRPLDTSFFPGPVARVTPKTHGSSVLVEIVLKQRATYREHVDGDTLSVDFDRPALR